MRRIIPASFFGLFFSFIIISILLPTNSVLAQTAGPANKTRVARYEALRALTGVHPQGNDNPSAYECLSNSGSGQSAVLGLQLKTTITVDEYNDSSFSPLRKTGGSFATPRTLFDSNSMSCERALSLYYETAFNAGSTLAEKRKAFLNYYYTDPTADATSNTITLKRSYNGTELLGKVRDYLNTLYSGGRIDSFKLWRDRIVSEAFNTCFKYVNREADHPSDAPTDEWVAFWETQNGGRKAVGYMAETLVGDGTYQDGVLSCDELMDYVSQPDNRRLVSFGTDDLQQELDEATRQSKIERAREILSRDSANSVKLCVAGSSAEQTFLDLPVAEQIDSIAVGLVDETAFEYSPTRYGVLTVNELSTASIKICLLDQSPIGQELQDTLSITAPSSARTDDTNGDEESLEDSCDIHVNNPLSWIICPVLQIFEEVLERYFNAANSALNFTIDRTSDSGQTIENVWGNMRTIANVLFVIAFLFLIISQSIGGKL